MTPDYGIVCRELSRTGRAYKHREKYMHITIDLANMSAIISLLAGVTILLVPRLLNYIVAGYLIVIGVLGLIS